MAGADANAKTISGRTPLLVLCKNSRFGTAKQLAVCAKLLIQAGADVDARDDIEFTPFYWALRYGRRTLAKTLLRSGALADHASLSSLGATKPLVDSVKAAGGWKPYAAKHKRVLVGLVAKCKPIPDDAAGHVVEYYCPEGGY